MRQGGRSRPGEETPARGRDLDEDEGSSPRGYRRRIQNAMESGETGRRWISLRLVPRIDPGNGSEASSADLRRAMGERHEHRFGAGRGNELPSLVPGSTGSGTGARVDAERRGLRFYAERGNEVAWRRTQLFALVSMRLVTSFRASVGRQVDHSALGRGPV